MFTCEGKVLNLVISHVNLGSLSFLALMGLNSCTSINDLMFDQCLISPLHLKGMFSGKSSPLLSSTDARLVHITKGNLDSYLTHFL